MAPDLRSSVRSNTKILLEVRWESHVYELWTVQTAR